MELKFTLPITLAEIEKAVVKATLEANNGNRTHTAKALGVGIRTLQRHLKKVGLTDYLKHVGEPADAATAIDTAPSEAAS